MPAAADEMTGSTGETVEVRPPSKVKCWVEMEGAFFDEGLTIRIGDFVARERCLQKLVKEDESSKPE